VNSVLNAVRERLRASKDLTFYVAPQNIRLHSDENKVPSGVDWPWIGIRDAEDLEDYAPSQQEAFFEFVEVWLFAQNHIDDEALLAGTPRQISMKDLANLVRDAIRDFGPTALAPHFHSTEDDQLAWVLPKDGARSEPFTPANGDIDMDIVTSRKKIVLECRRQRNLAAVQVA